MSVTPQSLDLTSYVAGTPIASSERLEVRNPYSNQRVGSVTLATRAQTEAAIQAGLQGGAPLTRYQRSTILDRARQLLEDGYIPSFCTACYRLGRTGEHFMEFAIPGFIQRHTNQATRKARVIETATSEGWCAPIARLAHATADAPTSARTPQAGDVKTIAAANPKAVAVWPEGKEL